ncbi:MAG: hypothetical protein A4E61_01823 [Syntrophorhabdus sp. PtaB.Bin184]|nr:MAG: hypothetical protein A4E61_01823 [Syntrophorhabdus sp. PtaB.Bin184]
MKNILFILSFVLVLVSSAGADRGPVMWHENVSLSQESQKVIILHNGAEEVLILGTELTASAEIDLLEFIPLPSEPEVGLARGNPFEAASRLMRGKGLVFLAGNLATKGGPGGASTVPVEIRFAEKMGIHDVTVVKINDIEGFSRWLEDFFRKKGIEADMTRFSRVFDTARDYMGRGYSHFVFDVVRVAGRTRFAEPLIYRFRTGSIYYPLKTSNLIGGEGAVEMILVLPGSVTDGLWQGASRIFDMGAGAAIELSSSSKLDRADVQALYPDGAFFGPRSRIYMQMLRYRGPYRFKDDFTYDVANLTPYAYRFDNNVWPGAAKEFTPPFTAEERRDLREFFCPKSGDPQYIFQVTDYRLDCWSFIPGEEYDVYAALFHGRLSGIPSGRVELEKNTTPKQLQGNKIKVDRYLAADFNSKNKVSLTLENAFPDDGPSKIRIRGDKRDAIARAQGRTFVSRVGFTRDGTRALVHVDHIAGPRSGAAYYVILTKKGGMWEITDSFLEAVH